MTVLVVGVIAFLVGAGFVYLACTRKAEPITPKFDCLVETGESAIPERWNGKVETGCIPVKGVLTRVYRAKETNEWKVSMSEACKDADRIQIKWCLRELSGNSLAAALSVVYSDYSHDTREVPQSRYPELRIAAEEYIVGIMINYHTRAVMRKIFDYYEKGEEQS